MKFLYVSYVSETPQFSGILKKVKAQTKAVSNFVEAAHYVFVKNNNVVLDTFNSTKNFPFPAGLRWKESQQVITDIYCEIIKQQKYDVVYIKGFLSNPYYYQIAKTAKETKKCKIIFEVPTYPYKGEYKRFFKEDIKTKNLRSFLGHCFEYYNHLITKPKFKRYVDIIVTFGDPLKSLWGIPAFAIENGFDIDSIKLRNYTESETLNIIGVAGTSVTHGFERLILSINQYIKNSGERRICFNIVGDNPTMGYLKELVDKNNLSNSVKFLGYMNASELSALYDKNKIAVSILGAYKTNLHYLSPLKTREYCAAGVPFIYAYDELQLDKNCEFALKFENNNSIFDFNKIIDFYDKCTTETSASQRAFTEKNYTWKKIMQDVFNKTDINLEEKNA